MSERLPEDRTATRVPRRDRDLLESDETLDDDTLDTLWDSFNTALDARGDRQLVFVKMVNAIRRQYKQKLRDDELHTGDTRSVRLPPEWHNLATPSTTEYAPSETPSEATVLRDSESRNDSTHQRTEAPAEVVVIPRVVIMAIGGITSRRFIQVTSAAGGNSDIDASVSVTHTICPETTFDLHCFQDGTVAFKSSKHENLYLRASTSADALANASSIVGRWFRGMGTVDAKVGPCRDQQRFKIHRLSPYSAGVVIESVHLPGKFIRLHQGLSMGTAVINLQDGHGKAEQFLLVVSPPKLAT